MIDNEPMFIPGVGAYYHVPPVWIASEPSAAEFLSGPLSELIRDEYRGALCHDIRVRARRDGLFVFDCSAWDVAGFTEVPAHRVRPGEHLPKEVIAAERAADLRAAMRAQLMNAHQACLSSAHHAVHRRASGLGAMVLPSRAVRLLDFETNEIGGLNSRDPFQRHVSELLAFTRGHRVEELRNRRIIESDTIEHSFKLLDSLLKSAIPDHLQLVELLYRAGVQYSEARFAESLILSWTVCERLIDVMWTRYVEARNGPAPGKVRLNSKRREKLRGRDFTASVVLEILELAGELPHELFGEVDLIRKARNDWLHSLGTVSDSAAAMAVLRTQKLMKHVSGIDISVCLSRSGATFSLPTKFFNSDHSVNWDLLRTTPNARR